MVRPVFRLSANATKLARKGHPWFYADDCAGEAEHGALVEVEGVQGHPLGVACHSRTSKIRLRMCGVRAAVGEDDAGFVRALVGASLARRDAAVPPEGAERLVHGEADGLPGLVVDRYADVLVVQATHPTIERNLDVVVAELVRLRAPRMVLARHDLAVRAREGLPEEVRLLHGERVESVEILEHGLRHRVDPWRGQKTGWYLDQAPARARVRALAKGRRALDLFAYQGGFALNALAGGAFSCLAVDQSQAALDLAAETARRHGLQGLATRRENAFAALRGLRDSGASFDLIVVDPPAFAKSRAERAGGIRGYRDLNHLALRALAPGGFLVTCSCSHHVGWPDFEAVLRQAAAELPFKVVLRERIMAGPDHPAWISLPESEYLKVLVAQRMDPRP
ncbi:MAG: class I SAM-dependent rRNA methyltransferase [Planctomycetes bacterium]|nr:class I SAM-dependent rRNA methyltransferase [Planctomycetota bacterium]